MAKTPKRGNLRKTKTRQVSMADIATALNVSVMTVSLALRDDKRLPESTRERVHLKAEELGYHRDPEISRLMAYVRNRKVQKLQANLAFMHFAKNEFYLRGGRYEHLIFTEAISRAEEMGYSMEPISLAVDGINRKRIQQIFRARNIQGVILGPVGLPDQVFLDDLLPVNEVASIIIGYAIETPKLNRVAFNHYKSAHLLLSSLSDRGFSRIGFVMERRQAVRVHNLWYAGLLSWHFSRETQIAVPPLILEKDFKSEMKKWLDEYQPEVIAVHTASIQQIVEELGYRVPEDISVCYFNAVCQPGEQVAAGINQNIETQVQLAVQHVVGQILARQSGVPEVNTTLLVDGSFLEGKTLRPR